MNFSCLCLSLVLPPSPPAATAGTACAPSICKMSALSPTVYPTGSREGSVLEKSRVWKLLLISLLETTSGIFSVQCPCSQILAEHSCAKEKVLFTIKVKVPGICLIAHTCPRAPLSAEPRAGYGVIPSTARRSHSKWAFNITYWFMRWKIPWRRLLLI